MTLDVESRLALQADVPAATAWLREHGGDLHWRAETDDTVVWAELRPVRDPEQAYFAKITWFRYPHAAPSVLFADAVGGAVGATRVWPQIAGYRAPVDICMPFTHEGFALHPEWTTGPDAWRPEGNCLLRVVAQLQSDMDHRYMGRVA